MTRALLIVLIPACGLGWIDTTDEDRLAGIPTSGAGPYGRLTLDDLTPAEEPLVIGDRSADVFDPFAIAGSGDRLRLWFARRPDGTYETGIYFAEVPSVHELPDVAPVPVLGGEQAWEGGVVTGPSLVTMGDELVMYYQGGPATSPAIGVARSSDGGATWQKAAAPVLTGAAAPAAVVVGAETWLYVTRPAMDGIWRAVDAGGGFVLDASPVVVPRPGLDDAFDQLAVGDPFVLAVAMRDGGTRFGMWFTGTVADPADRPAVGYAGSLDGVTWERFALEKPVLSAEARGPTVVLAASRAVMLFADTDRGHLAIMAAEHP